MNGKQPLLLILMITAFGIAVAAALWVFGSKSLEAHRTGLVNDLNHVASNAYLYRMKPSTLGGGGGSYEGYAIPQKLSFTGFGVYTIVEPVSADTLRLLGTSVQRHGAVEARVEATGFMRIVSYSGDFLELGPAPAGPGDQVP
jgi:hypothetical protein